MYDSWGASWGTPSAWAVSWVHTTPPPVVVVIDTHDDVKRINEYKRRKEELHEQILRAFEEVTGEAKPLEVIEEVVSAKTSSQPFALTRIRQDISELKEVNESILRVNRILLQEREMQDIAFILSVL